MFCTHLLYFLLLATSVFSQDEERVSAKDYDINKVLPPNPPVTHKVYFTLQYDDPNTDETKETEFVVALFGTVVPKTVRNFVELSKGVKAVIQGQDPNDVHDLGYEGSAITKVKPNNYISGGAVIPQIGPFSIYGAKFDDENFDIKFDRPGRVCTKWFGEDSNNSEFMVTTKFEPFTELEDRNVAFGQVVEGLGQLINEVQYVETDSHGIPTNPVKYLVSIVEDLKLTDTKKAANAYRQDMKKFRKGDMSVGVTMEDAMVTDEEEEGAAQGSSEGLSSGLIALIVLLSVAGAGVGFVLFRKFKRSGKVVSLRHE